MPSTGKIFTLISRDGVKFEVEEAVVMQSKTLKDATEDVKVVDIIPVWILTGKTLSKVIEYCKKHACTNDRSVDEEIKAWDAEFVKVDLPTVYDLLIAANYLNIKDLLDLMAQTVADMMKGKTPEQIRTWFGIKSDFTPEEEEQIRGENIWNFEGIFKSKADGETTSKVDGETASKSE